MAAVMSLFTTNNYFVGLVITTVNAHYAGIALLWIMFDVFMWRATTNDCVVSIVGLLLTMVLL